MTAGGSDLLVQLKGNHPKLLAAVREACQAEPHAEQSYAVDLGKRNRIEQRTVRLWHLPEGSGTEAWHDHFKVAVEVRRQVECFNTRLHCFERYCQVTETYRRRISLRDEFRSLRGEIDGFRRHDGHT